MDCKNAQGNPHCTCTYTGCARHGICCDCIEYHKSKGQMVGCYFTPAGEATYNRSMSNFIKDMQSK